MPITIVDTPGSSTANSFCDTTYADGYFETRAELPTKWSDLEAEDQKRFLVMATRMLVAMFRGQKSLMIADGGLDKGYNIVRRSWTGLPSTTTQKLPWPRTGMFDGNSNAISDSVIPDELKDATCEFAGQLAQEDRTLDNDVAAKGITSVSAGSVSVAFRSGAIDAKVLPDAVVNLLIPSWYVEEKIEGTQDYDFEAL